MLQIFRLFQICFEKGANAILTMTYIRSTFITDQRKFVEHFQYGKQIGKILDIQNRQKRHRAPPHILLGLKSEKSGNQVPNFDFFKIYEICSLNFCAEWIIRFPKRAHEVPK